MQEYGKDDYFIIDDKLKEEIYRENKENQNRKLVGMRVDQEDVFNEITRIEMVLQVPLLNETEPFIKDLTDPKQEREGLKNTIKFFYRMLVYPKIQTEELKSLENMVSMYPTIANRAIATLMEPTLKQKGKAIEASDYLEVFKI